MNSLRILISGAGIAGPALALCLRGSGARVTLVERAPALRDGGQAVDFRGPVHRDVLERLDLWEAIHERRTTPSALEWVDRHGQTYAKFPEVMMAGDVEILRGDLSRLLYERTHDTTEYRFGDHIEHLHDSGATVDVAFAKASPEQFDLVVGADGLHSATRNLAIAEEASVLRHQGYHLATFAHRNFLGPERRAQTYAEPGRAISVFANSAEQARSLLIYTADAPASKREQRDPTRLKSELQQRFAGMAWRAPEVLSALQTADDLYVDAIATVHVPSYSRGRVVLLGDAAYGGTLGGQGSSLAIVGAYILARELKKADHTRAFTNYEQQLRPYATRCQKGAMRVGGFFAPRTALALWSRNQMYSLLTSRPFSGLFERLVKAAASDFPAWQELSERA